MTSRARTATIQREPASHDVVGEPQGSQSGSDVERAANGQFRRAQALTSWGRTHISRFALSDGKVRLATATRSFLSGTLDGAPVCICGISDLRTASDGDDASAAALVRGVMTDAAEVDGATLALLFCHGARPWHADEGFRDITPPDVQIALSATRRPGAPMVSMRAGEDTDLNAIVAMNEVRSAAFRFHLNRDADFIKHGITVERLAAGLADRGSREMHFFVTEEGTIATGYVILRVRGTVWTLAQCGDRDPSGARVGALLQALVARDPSSAPPTIHGWLPPGFTPPQAHRVSVGESQERVLVKQLGKQDGQIPAIDSSIYWLSDHL